MTEPSMETLAVTFARQMVEISELLARLVVVVDGDRDTIGELSARVTQLGDELGELRDDLQGHSVRVSS